MEILFETQRLVIRRAGPGDQDIDFFLRLWNDPQVMRFVGFPYGLELSRAQVQAVLERPAQSGLNGRLVAMRRSDGAIVGECKLGEPDSDGLSETDVKLLPEFWGQGYGTEIKRGLLRYLFTHTECKIVQATPNVLNQASIRMQEAVGGVRTGEGVFEFPPEQAGRRVAVHYYTYQVYREDWVRILG
jgi:ribosomal-protein-alanine N-acetyltransferase